MTVEIKSYADHTHDLVVTGTVLVSRESFAVVDRIRDHLQHPEHHDNSESACVADGIRQWLAG